MTRKHQLHDDPKTKVNDPPISESGKKRKKDNSNGSKDTSSSSAAASKNEKPSKEDRRLRKAQRKAEKELLFQDIPKVDSNGIAYTKIQIRRMIRRVKNGLDPVPTEEEEREMKRQRKREMQVEEAELSGIIYDRKFLEKRNMDEDEEIDDDEEEEDEEEEHEQDEGEKAVDDEKEDSSSNTVASESPNQDEKDTLGIIKLKDLGQSHKARNKPVPVGYVCQACQNKNSTIHWIYDCPDKIHRPGCNQLAKKDRGIHVPSTRKVFVSGLPFDWKRKDLVDLFRNECGAIVEHCKLIMFEDTKRCKGQAFVTFDNDESAKKGLKLNGKKLDIVNKKGKQEGESSRKELTLGVTKVQHRKAQK